MSTGNLSEIEAQAELKQLIAKRGQVKSSLTRFSTFIDKCKNENTEHNIFQLESRLENNYSLLEQFNTLQNSIELLNEREISTNEREAFENQYYDLIQVAKNLIQERLPQNNDNASYVSSNNQNNANNCQNNTSVRFPIIDLPKFYGDYEKWGQFRDMFLSLVHNDAYLDNVKKFYYLLGSVKGDAARVIECIEVTNENYEVAWNLLVSRYQNESVIIKHHVSTLIELPNVGKIIHLELRKLTDSLKKHIRSLETLGEPVKQWDTLLFYLIAKKLDTATQKEWESLFIAKTVNNQKPIFSEFIAFLEKRCLLLETLHHQKNDYKSNSLDQQNVNRNKHFPRREGDKQFAGYAFNSKPCCPMCKENHPIFACDKLKSLSVASRIDEINKLKLCRNCLRDNHETSECKAQGCKICLKWHNTLLHLESPNKNGVRGNTWTNQNNRLSNQNQSFSSSYVHENHDENRIAQIMLSTANILVQDSQGIWHKCRALLDSGSQPNFITSKMQRILKFSSSNISVPVMGVGSSSLNINQKITTSVKSIHNDFKADLTCLVLDKITENLPNSSFNSNLLKIPSGIVLADYEFNKSREIDMLLGASIFYELIGPNQIKLGPCMPTLQQTQLGWIISGPIPIPDDIIKSNQRVNKNAICNLSINKTLENSIEKFWKIEEVSSSNIKSIEEQECEKSYIETVKRDNTGHLVVTLPTRENVVKLGNSVHNAIKRLNSMERKFEKNEQFKNQYINFMTEYENLGHMSLIKPNQINSLSSDIFYLPHHGVINESSETTKLRVVFDGSCKSSSGISLNDLLKVGPTIQNDLISILLRFRQHNIVITGDIAKMYRQVNVTENQRDLQRIVWRNDKNDEIKHYRLNTITYGTSSAAFLAVRSLQQVAIENQQFPQISNIIINDFYVDDLLTGTDTIENAIYIKQKLSNLLSQYGFELRKWRSNQTQILDQTGQLNDQYLISEDEAKKTLGLYWQPNRDLLTYKLGEYQNLNEKYTKRIILSIISKLFDPLGLLSPVIIIAKIMMQSLWEIKLGWDDVPPDHILKTWFQFEENLRHTKNIQIPRQVIILNAKHIEFHGFSDASQKAYAACIYIKSIDSQGNTLVRLLCAKTRVAPLKIITLPRLELCGALLLSQLYDKVKLSLNLKINNVYLWTDSTIVLSWIRSSPSSLKIFVGNRISEIQTLSSNVQWRHVPTEFNPADIASRGSNLSNLIVNDLWWNGPQWLLKNKDYWPQSIDLTSTDLEKRKAQVSHVSTINELELFSRFSTLYKLQRVVSLCLRFINNCRNKASKKVGELTLPELDNSLFILIKIAQTESFHNDRECLKRSKPLPTSSRLKSLDPFIDSQGLMRVGGRLANSNLSHDAKHQLLLNQNHALTRLIVLNEHHRHLHSGAQTILSATRQRFWILNGRSTIRNIISKCVTCFRVNPRILQQKMANLPADRVNQNRAFYIVGVDFAGPFSIKDGKLRNRAIIKAYLCVFVCFTTKAVHLELVSDLSAKSFLNTLKRFISRRGLCKRIYSDNGTNFVRANKEVKELYSALQKFINEREIIDWFLLNQIEWKFNPPYSPHRGGLWEAAVRQAKFHIKRIIGKLTLTFEDLYTIITQIEAIMNSRPLYPISNDPHDFSVLTPGHFLIGQSLCSFPEADITKLPENRLKQYQLLQQTVQLFWKKWNHDYLYQLQQRSRWCNASLESLQENSMVLLVDDNCPPMYWKLGRIVEVHKSSDNLIRTATIRTPTGLTTRAVQKLCVLPSN